MLECFYVNIVIPSESKNNIQGFHGYEIKEIAEEI